MSCILMAAASLSFHHHRHHDQHHDWTNERDDIQENTFITDQWQYQSNQERQPAAQYHMHHVSYVIRGWFFVIILAVIHIIYLLTYFA